MRIRSNLTNKIFLILFSIVFVLNYSCKEEVVSSTDPMQFVLNTKNNKIKSVLNSIEQFEVQILYTHIIRRNDSVIFKDYSFQVDSLNYFYPASTVKFPAAVATLEKLNENDSLDRNSRFYVEGDSIETTFTEAISAIFAVSNNEANNRLIEYLGQEDLNRRMKKRGVAPIRISHRLGYHFDDTATTPLVIYLNDSTTINYKGTVNPYPKKLELNKLKKGIGYIEDDSLLLEPFDFSLKNYYPIESQHALLKRIIFPENFNPEERFNLTDNQREFLLEAMHKLPRTVGYDPSIYFDGYSKFFLFGDTNENIPEYLKIYNKIGAAYGTLTDCAYILDSKNNVEFMLTATIHANKNQIFNDNQYEYDSIALPFLAEIGRQFYTYELNLKTH
ncbi:serine hydrolase [Aurantibacter sp.]|uniref:serine hydrolase n=1 Tax=Aurantibacter sp. TaxID=2807103 RepID=UPI003264A044